MKLQDKNIKLIDKSKAKALSIKAAKVLEEKKLEDIVLLELDEVSALADYFIIATASSSPQMKAGVDSIYKVFKEDSIIPYVENDNDPDSSWYLIDYGFLVAHIFTKEGREYYDLDKLWHDAKRIEY